MGWWRWGWEAGGWMARGAGCWKGSRGNRRADIRKDTQGLTLLRNNEKDMVASNL